MLMDYAEPVWEVMEEEVEELEDFEEAEVIEEVEEVEASTQEMHPSNGLKRTLPPTHQPLSTERATGQAFWPLSVQPSL